MSPKIRNIIQEIDDIIDLPFDDLVSWQDVLDWPVGETRNINGTFNTKIIQTSSHARFLTQIPPLAVFPHHWHDFTETCKVLSNVLADKKSGKEWEKDHIFAVSKGVKHIPWNPSSTDTTWLEVDFYK